MSSGDDEKPPTNGAVNGHAVVTAGDDDEPEETSEPDPEPPPDDIPESPSQVVELSAACARYVLAKYRVPLDGTPDTLSLVDQYVKDTRADLLVRPEAAGLVAASVGAYLGEVVKRAFGAEWVAEGDYSSWRLQMRTVYLTFNPLGMALEALTLGDAGGPGEDWHAHLETDVAEREEVEARLRSFPAVDPDEFYLPSTRFDVIEMIVEALAAKMRDEGNGDARFTAEDYRS
jgi:hypothetical protein